MKSYLPCVAFLVISGILTSPQTSNVTSVPVEEEPLHKVVFKNDAVTVMHVIFSLPAPLRPCIPTCARTSSSRLHPSI